VGVALQITRAGIRAKIVRKRDALLAQRAQLFAALRDLLVFVRDRGCGLVVGF
jgi:hypothetical protein